MSIILFAAVCRVTWAFAYMITSVFQDFLRLARSADEATQEKIPRIVGIGWESFAVIID